MTNPEFSNHFTVLVNSYRRFRDFDDKEPLDTIEFDEYEKSLYLTKAQEELVLSLYNGRNSSLQSFEETEELRRYLSNLVEEVVLSPITNSAGRLIGMDGKNSYFFTLPDGKDTDEKPAVWFITYEAVEVAGHSCGDGAQMEVVPARQDEYHRIKKNPFRGPNNRRALRFDLSENNVEIVCKYEVEKYYVRYIRKVKPIVLTDMPDGVSIEGEQNEQKCELHESLHQKILELAVEMALRGKGIAVSQPQRTEK